MAGSRNNGQPMGGGEGFDGLRVQGQHLPVQLYHDQQGGAAHLGEGLKRQVWPSSTADQGTDGFRPFRGGDQGGRRTGTGSKQPYGNRGHPDPFLAQSIHRAREPLAQQGNVETPLGRAAILGIFFRGEEIQEHCGQPGGLKTFGHLSIAGAEATTAAAMGKHHNPTGGWGDLQGGLQGDTGGGQADLLFHGAPFRAGQCLVLASSGAVGRGLTPHGR